MMMFKVMIVKIEIIVMMFKVMIEMIVSCSTTAFATCSRDSSVKPAIVATLSHQGFRPWKQYRDNIEQHILSVIALIFTLREQGLLSLFIDPRVSILPILPNIGEFVRVMLKWNYFGKMLYLHACHCIALYMVSDHRGSIQLFLWRGS